MGLRMRLILRKLAAFMFPPGEKMSLKRRLVSMFLCCVYCMASLFCLHPNRSNIVSVGGRWVWRILYRQLLSNSQRQKWRLIVNETCRFTKLASIDYREHHCPDKLSIRCQSTLQVKHGLVADLWESNMIGLSIWFTCISSLTQVMIFKQCHF